MYLFIQNKAIAIIKTWCVIDYLYLNEQSLFNKPKNIITSVCSEDHCRIFLKIENNEAMWSFIKMYWAKIVNFGDLTY